MPGPSQTASIQDALLTISREAFAGRGLEQYFGIFCVKVADLLPFDRAVLVTWDETGEGTLTARHECSRTPGEERSWLRNGPASMAIAGSFMASIVQGRQPRTVPLAASPCPDILFLSRLGFRSSVMVPLFSSGQPIGVLLLLGMKDLPLSAATQDFLVQASRPLSMALHNAVLQETLSRVHVRLAESEKTDWLTGLVNRKYFVQAAEGEIARSRRFSTVFSILFADIDHFKDVNTRNGHAGGDKALKHVASVMKKTMRPFDVVSRYGGEEFALLLPQTGREGAMAAALRLCAAVRNAPASLGDGNDLKLTISIGIATFPQHGDDLDTVMQQADRAMYAAKDCGGNTVSSAE